MECWKLLVVNTSSHMLWIVDGLTNKILHQLSISPDSTVTAIVPAGTKAYLPMVDASRRGSLFVANLTAPSIYRLPIDIPHPSVFAGNETFALFADLSGSLYRLDAAALTIDSWGQPFGTACCKAITISGGYLYTVWEKGEAGLFAVHDTKGAVCSTCPLPGIPGAMAIDPGGNAIIPVSGRNDRLIVYMIQPMGGESSDIAITAECPVCASPVHTRPLAAVSTADTVYISGSNGIIVTLDLDTLRVEQHANFNRTVESFCLIPGTKTALATCPLMGELALIDLDRRIITAVTDTPDHLGAAAIVPHL